jgi:hypothetical protein
MLLPIDHQNQKFVILFDWLFFKIKIEFDFLEKPIRMMKYQLNVYQQCQLTQKKILKVFFVYDSFSVLLRKQKFCFCFLLLRFVIDCHAVKKTCHLLTLIWGFFSNQNRIEYFDILCFCFEDFIFIIQWFHLIYSSK